jgi:hypothetical protein
MLTELTEPMATIIGAISGAVFGGLFGTIGALLTLKAAERKRADALFSTALQFMGGGSQRRNLGIASISMYWREFPQYKNLCAQILIGSALYLLTESEQKDKAHETYNLHRIMDLLEEIGSDLKKREGHKRLEKVGYKRLREVIDKLTVAYNPKPEKGLWVKKSDLETWQENLKDLLSPSAQSR